MERTSTVVASASAPTDNEIEIGSDYSTDVAEADLMIKSVERVKDIGEVFTPASTVRDMLELLPGDVWQPHPSATFFEPGCGDGNFLVAILERKLAAIKDAMGEGSLPAGEGVDAVHFHSLEALASIYAVDISPENVIGDVPGHEVGARRRMIDLFSEWHLERELANERQLMSLLAAASWIADRNIMVGNLLANNGNGSSRGPEDLPLVDYRWNPSSRTVVLYEVTLGAVMAEAESEATGAGNLFLGVEEPAWSGRPINLPQAGVSLPTVPKEPARNGNGGAR